MKDGHGAVVMMKSKLPGCGARVVGESQKMESGKGGSSAGSENKVGVEKERRSLNT